MDIQPPVSEVTQHTFGGPGPIATEELANTEAARASADAAAAAAAIPVASEIAAPPAELVTSTRESLTALAFPESVVSNTLAWLAKGPSQSANELATLDAADSKSADRELRALWGAKFESNLKAIRSYVDERLDPGVADVIRGARTPDGHAIGSDPALLQRLLGAALKPQPKKEAAGSLEEEKKAIFEFMRKDRPAYDRDEALQLRYRQLIEKSGAA